MISTLKNQWFIKYSYPGTISFKQGKVQVSKLEKKINKLAPLEQTVTYKSRMNTFNTETEQQWKQNQRQISEEEFVNMVNFFHNLRKPELERKWSNVNLRDSDDDDENSDQENEDEAENDFKEIGHLTTNHPTSQLRWKTISLCRHKLQGRTGCRPRGWRQRLRPHK
jgi:hypothetical protein